MSTDELPEKFPRERRRRERTKLDGVAARKRKLKSRESAKVARATRKKQRR
jgi:hypothetical protein